MTAVKQLRKYPGEKGTYIIVRMAIEVDPEVIDAMMEDDELTAEKMAKVMEKGMEQIKSVKFGIPTKLPDWFKAVDCAEIERSKEAKNG